MRIITGIQPSGTITLGNYLGSIKNFQSEIKGNESLIFIADQHALTVNPSKKELNDNTKKLISLYMAMDIHKSSKIFVQSSIGYHSELCWILQSHTRIGELERMTQFKDKSKKTDSVSVGLFTYPTLMAADILLYQADLVPVGEDQKQHLELTRDIAQRVNTFYGSEIFKIPEPKIQKSTAKIYSLTEPTKKMSKSDENPKSYISILDEPKVIEKKIKSATTDSIGKINYDPINQPGVSNLLVIYSACKNISIDEAITHFTDQNYGFLKSEVSNAIIKELEPIQQRFYEIFDDDEKINSVLVEGFDEANKIAFKTMRKVKSKVGYYNVII